MISIAVGQALSKHILSLLDAVFACGLCDSLPQALVDMAHYIPPAKPIIQERLLDLLSQVLSGRPFMALGRHPAMSACRSLLGAKQTSGIYNFTA